MILADVMEEIAVRLDTITGLRVYGYPPDKPEIPAGIISYPETIDFDYTYQRGADQMTLPVVVVLGKVVDRATRAVVSDYASGSGTKSIKAVLESGTYTKFKDLDVTQAEFDVVTYNSVDYLAILFTVVITGSGTS